MSARTLRLAWRRLAAQPGYWCVAILGLAAGCATCFVLVAAAWFAFGYNRHVPDAHDVVAVKQHINVLGKPGWFEAAPLPLLRVAEKSGMTLAAAMAIPIPAPVKTADGIQRVPLLAVTAGFTQVFGLRAEEGDLERALTRPDTVALTRRTARRLLGTDAALGRIVHVDGNPFVVAAIVADPPAASSLDYGMLASAYGAIIPAPYRDFHLEREWGAAAGYLYARLLPAVRPAAFAAALQHGMDDSPLARGLPADVVRKLGGRKMTEIGVTRLTDLYFDKDLLGRPTATAHGDRTVVLALAAVGVLVLVLAAANYVNLATVQVVRRRPEIVLRKVLGAGAQRLAAILLAESMATALVAGALGLVAAWLLLPPLSALADRPLEGVATPGMALAALGIAALTGLFAGVYPAAVALGMRPAEALAARPDRETHGALWLRRALTVLQLTVAMGLTAATLAVAWQARFASTADPGFDPAPLLVMELPRPLWRGPEGLQLRDALRRLPHVRGVAFAENAIGQPFAGSNGPIRRPGGPEAVLVARSVSTDFFGLYGVEALAGRTFDPAIEKEGAASAVMLNGAGARALGFASPAAAVGETVTFNHAGRDVTARVVGIVPDLRHESLREKPQPMFFRNALDGAVLTIRVDGDPRTVEREALALFQRYFPTDVPVLRPAASYFAENYAQDLRLATLLAVASGVAILLSAFGIYVLSAYNVQRRSREIVLRKLFGAGRAAIARLLGREFAVLLAAGAVIGLPPAALAIQAYLAGFVERAPVGGWTLLAALAIALLVALLATLRHMAGALRATPATILRA